MVTSRWAGYLDKSGRVVYNRDHQGRLCSERRKATGVTRMDPQDRLRFLRGVLMFAEMDDDELMHLSGDLWRRALVAGKTLFYQGDPGDAIYVVESGMLRVYVHAEEGQEVSVVLCGPGDFFGEISLLDQLPRSATVVALEDTVLWGMDGQDFLRHLRSSHHLALNVMLMLSTRLRATTDSIRSLSSLDVTRRIAKKLLRLALRQGIETESGVRIGSKLTQGDLASLISASRESTNRSLRALQCKGLIDMQEGYIVLLKPEELSNLVGSEDTWW
jgi:CRP/FNR family transcriptional regulator, cyclic AMP receptor protein